MVKLPESLLKILNIGCVSLANNHIYDFKMQGLISTINILDELGIYHTGAGWKPEHLDPVIIDPNLNPTGFLAYVDLSTNPCTETFPELYINYFDPDKVKEDLKSLKNSVESVICSIHWGKDYSSFPTSTQVKIAHDLIDAGADIIMGHHPHVLQPFEKYKEGWIFYSLGSLCYGDHQWNGKMRSLRNTTKKSCLINFSNESVLKEIIGLKELIGNYIVLTNFDYYKWTEKKWRKYNLSIRYSLFKIGLNFHEKYLIRIYNYFFGYYRNPFMVTKEIIQNIIRGKVKQ